MLLVLWGPKVLTGFRFLKPILLCIGSLFLVSVCIGKITHDPGESGLTSITASDLESTVSFLASDELQGRGNGTIFNEITSNYLAHRFQLLGLEPAGDKDSFFQYFTLVQMELGTSNSLAILVPGQDAFEEIEIFQGFFPSHLSATGFFQAPVVFAGYGIVAPHLDYNDYRDLNVENKIVLMLNHEPGEKDPNSPFQGLVSTDHGLVRHKILNAQRQGALGVLLTSDVLHHPTRKEFFRVGRSVWPENRPSNRHYLQSWKDDITIPVHHVSTALANSMLEHKKTNLKILQQEINNDYQPRSLVLDGVEARMEATTTRTSKAVRNVLAILPGVHPQLRNEVVILGAHFDHISAQSNSIYNGADDNASGTAGLLELAEAFALSKQKPKRSLLFAGWNSEEWGLLGSYYYVSHPIFSLEQTVAMLQMDMIGRNEEISNAHEQRFRGLEQQSAEENSNSLNVLGYSRSSDLQKLVQEANRIVDLKLNFRYDNHPLNLLRRSDHWPFLVHGVPVSFFHTGLHPDYHRTSDTAEKLNYPKMEKVVRLIYLTAWQASNQTANPKLLPLRQQH